MDLFLYFFYSLIFHNRRMEIELILFLLLFNLHLAKFIRTYMLFLFSCTYVISLSYSVNFILLGLLLSRPVSVPVLC